ncbi:hypothetical protein B0I35DRAFT_16598 [Stachybotrys elegans]|uniref:Uncharacterized protein n=1 Tax=Stachybotrys elegans TaxID=80388 RepID=A0A8K0T1W4_9HYPO|nr:hypothetical protein B0I35DRAFT_16598 [Stachybotrys elegans]
MREGTWSRGKHNKYGPSLLAWGGGCMQRLSGLLKLFALFCLHVVCRGFSFSTGKNSQPRLTHGPSACFPSLPRMVRPPVSPMLPGHTARREDVSKMRHKRSRKCIRQVSRSTPIFRSMYRHGSSLISIQLMAVPAGPRPAKVVKQVGGLICDRKGTSVSNRRQTPCNVRVKPSLFLAPGTIPRQLTRRTSMETMCCLWVIIRRNACAFV